MPENIYVVDDDESVCRALKILLMSYGFEVKTFNSAQSFFDTVPFDEPGCLLLDIHMPGIDGWETLKRLIKSGSSRPVILMSADKNIGLNVRALKAGAKGYLQKPFDDQALVNLIKVTLEDKEKI